MTSKLTTEQLEEWVAQFDEDGGCDATDRQLEALIRQSLAAMDRESITVTDDMAYAFHHALTDSMIGADDVEEIKTGLRAVFANLTAPVVSAEYPDRLPCSVLLEPGLRFGKGIKTSTMLAALARRAVYESDMAALSSEERAEFQARIEDFKALIAQPAPVVMDDKKLRELFDAWFASDCSFDQSPAASEADNIAWRESYWYVWRRCHGAMLQELQKSAGTEATCRGNENVQVLNTIKGPPALGSLPKTVEVQNTNSPVNDVTTGKPLTNGDSVTCKSLTCINPAPALVSLPKNAKSLTGNYPVIPDSSEHCPCCGKKLRRACSVEGCGGKHVAHGLCQKHYDMKRWEDPEQVERFREAGRRYRGKKKSTVATPQEPKP